MKKINLVEGFKSMVIDAKKILSSRPIKHHDHHHNENHEKKGKGLNG